MSFLTSIQKKKEHSTMAKPKIIGHSWNFASIWNEALRSMPDKPLQKREHIWASELGGSFIDRYLKMHAIPYTNPPNDRSRRKFVAGHIWEWIIGLVLTMVGVLKQKQLRGEVEIPGLLRVTGKLDFVAGGVIDWERSRAKIREIQQLFAVCFDDMPPFILYAIDKVLASMERQYGNNPIKEMILENKAVSTPMFEKIEKSKRAIPHNVLQSYHYILANKTITEAKLNYVCKDDSIMQEFDIEHSRQLLGFYKADVQEMTVLFQVSNKKNPLKTMPPKEAEVLFDADVFRFEKNFRVEYSNYLEMLYGYKTPEEFRMKWASQVSNWNRVFKRCVSGAKMTDMNKQVLHEVTKKFPFWDDMVYKAKSKGVFLKEEE